jgi:hypothetical protein
VVAPLDVRLGRVAVIVDPSAAAERAAALGGQVLLEPTAEVREGTMALVTDPSGAVLALRKWNS